MTLNKFSKQLFCPLLGLLLFSCNIPKDPNDSWAMAERDGLQIGVVKVAAENQSRIDQEKKLVEGFAKSHHLKTIFKEGAETDLLEQLENYRLHTVIGGFDKKTVWKKIATPTKPYDQKHVLLVPKGENRLLQKLEQYLSQNQS